MPSTGTIIVGQGLSGTWLSNRLYELGQPFLVIDHAAPRSASRAASGVINPVTGRRIVETWKARELMPQAQEAYARIGSLLDKNLLEELEILDFFGAPDRRLSFAERMEGNPFMHLPPNEQEWAPMLNYPFGFGVVKPAYLVDIQALMAGWRSFLQNRGWIIEIPYDPVKLRLVENGVHYETIRAERIVFCDGTAAMDQPFFRLLPFGINKGEALIADIPGLPPGRIYKKGLTIVPWQEKLFWVGSTYAREFESDLPSAAFRQETEGWLKGFLKLPFTIKGHLSALRPATLERRPFVGFHPVHRRVGILNGMGTKGVSLAPYAALQLARHITFGAEIDPEMDVDRFKKILSR